MNSNRKFPFLFFFLVNLTGLMVCNSMAQNAPITTAAIVGGAVPGTITVPVTVINFTNIGAISLSLDYDFSVLHFIQGTPNPQLSGLTTVDNNLGTGIHRLIMGWFGSGRTLSNGSTIMTLSFTYISGNTTLAWFDDGASCEYADGNSNVLNDVPQSTYYINGYVCGGIGNPGTIIGPAAVCQGQQGVTYSVAPLTNVTGYGWTVPAGANVTSGGTTNSITVDYSQTAVSGNVSVYGINECGNGPGSTLPVTVGVLPVANAGNDTTIPYGTSTTLHAALGGTENYNYHWSPEALLVNPDVRAPMTVILTSTTLFTVNVTNQNTLCQNTDGVVVTITGGPLSVNPVAVPSSVCNGDTAQLHANAGGGSGNYLFTWTSIPAGTPPWSSILANPFVSPDVSTQYLLSVNDGFTNVSGSTWLAVNSLPTATLSGGDTLCGDGATTILTINLTGVPPWNFIYSNGVTTVPVYNQTLTPCLLTVSDPGIYTILFVEDAHCTGIASGSAAIAHSPIPLTPVITQAGNELFSNSCCGNQWYLNGLPIPGATAQTYAMLDNGQYFDIVTLNGCSSDTSNMIDVITNISKSVKPSFEAFPNPARDFLFIKAKEITGIYLYSSEGILIRNENISSSDPAQTAAIDVRNLSPGIYFLNVISNSSNGTERILIW